MQSAVYKKPCQTSESTKTWSSIFQKSCQTSESSTVIEALLPKMKNIFSQTSTSSNMQEKPGSIVFAKLADDAKQMIKSLQDTDKQIKWNQKVTNEKYSSPDLNSQKTHLPSPEFSWYGYNAHQSKFSTSSPLASDVLSENSNFKATLSKEHELTTSTLNQAARQSCRYTDSRKNSVDRPSSQIKMPFFFFSSSSSIQNINDKTESKFSSQSTFLPHLTTCSDKQAPSFREGLNLSSTAEHPLNEYSSDSSAYPSNSLLNFINRHSNNELNVKKTVTISSDPSPPPYSHRKQIPLPSNNCMLSYKTVCSPDTSSLNLNNNITSSENHLNTSPCLTSISHSNLTFGVTERKRNILSSNYDLKKLPPQPSSYLSVPFSSGVMLQNSSTDTFGSVNSADANSCAFEMHSTSSCNTFDSPINSNNNDTYEITVNSIYSTPLNYAMPSNFQNTDRVVSSNNKRTDSKAEFTRSQSETFFSESPVINIDTCFESHQSSKNKAHLPKHISLSFPSGNPSMMIEQDKNRFSQNNLLNNHFQQNPCLFSEIEKRNPNIPEKSALNSTSKNVQHDFKPFCKNVDIPSKNIYWRLPSTPESRHTSISRINIANPNENKCIRGSTPIRNKYLVSSPPYKSDILPKTSNIQSFERFPSNEVYELQNNNKTSSPYYMTSRPKEVNPTIYNYKELQSNRLPNNEHKYNTVSQPQQNPFVPARNVLKCKKRKTKKSSSSIHIKSSHGTFTIENESPSPKFVPALQKTVSGFLETVNNSNTSSDHSHSGSNTSKINDLQTACTLPTVNNEQQFFDVISPREKNILDSIIDGLAAEVEDDLRSSNTLFSSNTGLFQLDDEDLKVILETPGNQSRQTYEIQSNAKNKHDIPQKAADCFAGVSKNRFIHQENDCIGADYFNFLHHSSKRMRREGPSKVDIEYEMNSSPAGMHSNDKGLEQESYHSLIMPPTSNKRSKITADYPSVNGMHLQINESPTSEKKDESGEIVGNSTNVTNHAIQLFRESRYEDFFEVITINQFPEEQKRKLCEMWKAAIILNFEQKTREEVSKQMRVVFLENNPPPLTIQNV